MSQNLVINGTSYTFPDVGEEDWGQNVTDWAVAVTSGMLQKAGGSFILTAEVDFGANFGLKAAYYKSRATNPATTGIVRLGNTESVSWRNAANSANLALLVNASDELEFNGTPLSVGATPILSGNQGNMLGPTYPTADYKVLRSLVNAVLTTLYTVPVGRKALFLGFYAFDLSGSANNIDVKLTTSAGDIDTGSSATGNGSVNDNGTPVVLSAGNTVRVNTSGNANVYIRVAEFETSYPISTVYFNALSSGNNTIYTVPSGKRAYFYRPITSDNQAGMFILNGGAAINFYPMLVKVGNAAGPNFQTSTTILEQGQLFIPEQAGPGDFVAINASGAMVTGIGWLTYIEIATA